MVLAQGIEDNFRRCKVSIWPGTELQPIGPNLYIFTTNKSYSALTVNVIVRFILTFAYGSFAEWFIFKRSKSFGTNKKHFKRDLEISV